MATMDGQTTVFSLMFSINTWKYFFKKKLSELRRGRKGKEGEKVKRLVN